MSRTRLRVGFLFDQNNERFGENNPTTMRMRVTKANNANNVSTVFNLSLVNYYTTILRKMLDFSRGDGWELVKKQGSALHPAAIKYKTTQKMPVLIIEDRHY